MIDEESINNNNKSRLETEAGPRLAWEVHTGDTIYKQSQQLTAGRGQG